MSIRLRRYDRNTNNSKIDLEQTDLKRLSKSTYTYYFFREMTWQLFLFLNCSVGSILRQGRFRRDPRQLEEEEEMWFNEDDYGDDDSPTSASATSASASSGGSPVGGAVSAAAVANNSSPNVTTNTGRRLKIDCGGLFFR